MFVDATRVAAALRQTSGNGETTFLLAAASGFFAAAAWRTERSRLPSMPPDREQNAAKKPRAGNVGRHARRLPKLPGIAAGAASPCLAIAWNPA
jgi:hypothetical protein